MNNTHNEKEFKVFLSQLKETNATLDFFCDFDKIKGNVGDIEIKLNTLNYLIGKQDMEAAIRQLWNQCPDVFSVLDILIAVRKGDKKKVIGDDGNVELIENYFDSADGVIKFIKDTGLMAILQDKQIKNLVDYVFGVEVGLDTNARKNRSGHLMENRIANIFADNGIEFRREVYSTEYPQLSILGEDKKRFDFVVTTSKKTYFIEVNFYSSKGSKLYEVARSYSDIGPKINSLDNFEFVWITDGQGWYHAKKNLEEAFFIIPDVYNLTTIGKFISKIKSDN